MVKERYRKFYHLRDAAVIDIRQRANSYNVDELAHEYDVTPMTIRYAATGRTYEHLNQEHPPVELPRRPRTDGLTDSDKRRIRELHEQEGMSLSELGKLYPRKNGKARSDTYMSFVINGIHTGKVKEEV